MSKIPIDIVELCILPRLPVKSLLRFKSVSKSWRTLISSNDFILLHNRQRDLSSDENRVHIFPGESCTLHLHYLDAPLAPVSLCPYPWPQPILSSRFSDEITIRASCEYFLLVSRWYSHSSGLVLLNPFTRIYYEIPDNTLSGYPKYGLYLDEDHDDLKVVRVAGWKITIFSLKTNLWTLITTKPMMYRGYHMEDYYLCVNKNLLYTILHHYNDYWNIRIICFDIQAKQWTKDVPLPSNNPYVFDLCVFDGLLCALGCDKEAATGTLSAWVMKDYSWVKLMTVVSNNTGDRDYRPIAYRKGSRHEILCRRIWRSELFWYNLRDKEISKVDFKGYPEDGSSYNGYHLDHICKESLMNFRGVRPQS
ncbi:F-box protein CPR1-like [Silene latifolia]|uniref:F-box protein CPR1-like n=1 Tax=Silene latifolia TaxID=37657 RepID=UPI003D76AA92